MNVQLKLVPDYPGLLALGTGYVQGVSGSALRGRPDRDGYLYVSVTREGSKNRQDRTAVHTLICLAFHGPRPTPTHQVAHGNGIPDDNRPSNLRWATVAENHADKREHGTDLSGERNGRAKLSREKIAEARRLIGSGVERQEVARRFGVERQEVARRFGVNRSTLRLALNGQTWKEGR